jgi:hypothetical protein
MYMFGAVDLGPYCMLVKIAIKIRLMPVIKALKQYPQISSYPTCEPLITP